jgi:dTDP-D-glucose 4,6-dehydratase
MKDKYPDIEFVTVDKMDYCSNTKNVDDGKATIIKGNVGNAELIEHLIHEYEFDYVFHFAAQSHVDNSFENALTFTKDNVHATHVLIEACRYFLPNVEFIHFSTDEVYGESVTDVPFTEKDAVLKPTNPYSASKAAAERVWSKSVPREAHPKVQETPQRKQKVHYSRFELCPHKTCIHACG